MARVKGIIGQMVAGNIEGLVFVQRNGKTYIRKAPDRSKANWTDNQKLHRKRFSAVNEYCARFKYSLIKQIWNREAEGGAASGYHLFLKANMAAFGIDGTLADSSKLRFSNGSLPVANCVTVSREAAANGTIVITWQNDPYTAPVRLQDKLMVIAGKDGNVTVPIATGVMRSEASCRIQLPVGFEDSTDSYLYFVSADNSQYSADQWHKI